MVRRSACYLMKEEEYQVMLKKVRETSYQTTEDEQREFEVSKQEGPSWDDTFMSQIEADIQSFKENLDKRAAKEGFSELEVQKQFIRYATNRYEQGARQLMAMYDVNKKKYFLKEGQTDTDSRSFVQSAYNLSLAIDSMKQSLENQKAALKDLEKL